MEFFDIFWSGLFPLVICLSSNISNFGYSAIAKFPFLVMSEKKLFRSRSILDDDALAANLRAVLEYSGMSQAEFADALGIKPQAMSSYLLNRDNRKAINLYPKMVEMGVSGDWYLTGEGPMLVSQLRAPSSSDRHAMEVGKRFIDLMKFSQEEGTNSQSASSTQAERSGAERSGVSRERGVVIPDALPFSGPPPVFSPEDEERLFGPSKSAARRTE